MCWIINLSRKVDCFIVLLLGSKERFWRQLPDMDILTLNLILVYTPSSSLAFFWGALKLLRSGVIRLDLFSWKMDVKMRFSSLTRGA